MSGKIFDENFPITVNFLWDVFMKKVYIIFRHLSIGIYIFSQELFTVKYIFRQEITYCSSTEYVPVISVIWDVKGEISLNFNLCIIWYSNSDICDFEKSCRCKSEDEICEIMEKIKKLHKWYISTEIINSLSVKCRYDFIVWQRNKIPCPVTSAHYWLLPCKSL